MLPPQSVAAVKGLHQNELILRYSGLTRAELALGAARLKAAMRRIDRQMYLMKYKNPTVAGQQPPWGFGAPEGTRTHTLKAREPKGYVTLVKDFQSPPYHKGRASFPTLQKIFGRDRPNTC